MDDRPDRAEPAPAEELERYRTLAEAVDDVMYALDESGRITLINGPAVERLGYSKAELLGTHVSEVLPPAVVERGTECIVDLLSDPDRRRDRFEFRATRPDGEERVFEDRLAVLTDDGAYAGSVGVIRDITAHRRRREELQRQNERLDEFASALGHDLRNPLQVARGYLEQARETGDADAFERTERAHDRMETIIDDVLTLARQGERVTEPTHTDLDAVARDAWRTVDTEEMTLSVIGNIEIEAAPDRLRTLLENLFRNSVEHSSTSSRTQSGDAVEHGTGDDDTGRGAAAGADDEHGAVDGRRPAHPGTRAAAGGRASRVGDRDGTVTVTVGPIETMPTTTRLTNDAVRGFYVADDGPGIPESERGAVFESGYSTSPDGTGFGLAIVEGIAEAHGWAVTVTESRDGGARFEFTGAHSDRPL